MTHKQAIEKLTLKLIEAIEHSKEEYTSAYADNNLVKASFHKGTVTAMELVLEDIYNDIIIL